MAWRLLLLLCKSALLVALLELLSPFASDLGLRFPFLDTMAGAIAQSTALPYPEAQVLFLFVLAMASLEVADFVWTLLVD